MAKGNWFADPARLHERTVKDQEGEEATIWIKEFAEKDIERRQQNSVIKNPAGKGRRGRGGMDFDFRLENLRRFDLIEGLVDWNCHYPNGEKVELPDVSDPKDNRSRRQKWEILRELHAKVSQQIWNHIKELNEIDDEEESVTEQKPQKPVSREEGPYAPEDFSGNGDSPYESKEYEEEEGASVVPLDRS